MASEFFKFNATKEQKILLAILGSILIGWFVFQFFLLTPFNNYKQAKAVDAELEMKLRDSYDQIMVLNDLKKAYMESVEHLESTKSALSIDGSRLLTMLTKNSPVTNFFYSSLEMKNITVQEDSIVQYPFEIGFQEDYAGIVRYLLYQESSLPISFIKEIDVKTSKNDSTKLDAKVSGVIFKVN